MNWNGLLRSESFEDVDVVVEGATEFSLVDSCFSLHSIFHTIFSLCFSILYVKGSQTLQTKLLRIVRYLVVMNPFRPSGSLAWLEI